MKLEDMDRGIREAIASEVAAMLTLAARCHAASTRPAGRGSLALADQHAAPDPEERPLGRHALLLATTALAVAADHIRTFASIMQKGPMPIYALYTVLRTAIETAALCRWLVDPAQTSEERVARGVGALLEDYRERRSFERSFATPNERASGKSGADRYHELIADRDAAGVAPVAMPGATDMVLRYGPADDDGLRPDWPYRLASAFAHGLSWSLLASTLGEPTFVGGRVMQGSVTANEGVVWLVATKARQGVELAVDDLEGYMRRGST